jgi:hypothetical protein
MYTVYMWFWPTLEQGVLHRACMQDEADPGFMK